MLLKTWSRPLLPMLFLLALPALSMAQVSVDISVGVPPPELPVYDQPPIPDDGYIWTPGYWAWSDDDQDYYWVPGTWVLAPQPEFLWTPGYWATEGAVFVWHLGYWGPHVGFYGGINYGYGYVGRGYEGGYWQGGRLYYNRSVNNIGNTNITNVYNKTVINNVTVNRVSYNGASGVRVQPTPAEQAAARERHIAVTPVQRQHEQIARNNPALRASQNQGHPPIAATPRPGAFSGAGVVSARGGSMSVVHSQPQSRAEPQYRAEPQRRAAQPETGQPETRMSQPAPRPAPPEVQRAQRPPIESRPPVEQRRLPEQTQPPRQDAAPRPESAPHPEPKPREAPRHEEHPPER
jgi:hypothetical protein